MLASLEGGGGGGGDISSPLPPQNLVESCLLPPLA